MLSGKAEARPLSVAILLAALPAMFPGVSFAQAVVAAQVQWDNEKPRKVQFQDEDGNTQFADRSTHFFGEKNYTDSLYRTLDVVVQYADGTRVPFRVRGQVDARRFNFTVAKPTASIVCSYRVADEIEPLAQSSDQNVLIATMQRSRAMLANTRDPCPPYLVKRVSKAYFDASCNLAKQTSFFDISPEARQRLLAAYEHSNRLNTIKGQISACEKEVRKEVIKPVAAAMRVAVNRGNIARYAELKDGVGDLVESAEWQAASDKALGSDYFDDLDAEARAVEARLTRDALEVEAEIDTMEMVTEEALEESADEAIDSTLETETMMTESVEELGEVAPQ